MRCFYFQLKLLYYRTYVKLSKSGQKEPMDFERTLLSYAILDLCSGSDLAPLYKEWNIPLDRAAMDALLKKYKLKG